MDMFDTIIMTGCKIAMMFFLIISIWSIILYFIKPDDIMALTAIVSTLLCIVCGLKIELYSLEEKQN